MIDAPLSEAVWRAVLGPLPDGSRFVAANFARVHWPERNEGPHDGVFWLRFIEEWLIAHGGTIEAAEELRRLLRRKLQSGEWKVALVCSHDGETRPIPAQSWLATGEDIRALWWSQHWARNNLETFSFYMYLFSTEPLQPAAQNERHSAVARARNTDAKMIYALSRIILSDAVDKRGAAAELVADMERIGMRVSRDTLAERLTDGRHSYDPALDTTKRQIG